MSTRVLSLFNFILYKDCIEKECQCDRWPQSIIKRLQVKSQGWAMCLCGAQLSSPHYLRHSERWIRALPHSLLYQLTRGEGEDGVGSGEWGGEASGGEGWVGSVQAWAAHSFCMSVSFHNSSAKHDCQESLQLQRSIRTCQPAITTER